jgi:MFS family permease
VSAALKAVRRSEILIVRATAAFQGLALVTFPTLSSVLTDPDRYDLSRDAYGALFVPQSLLAIALSLGGAGLVRRYGLKRIFLIGLTFDVLSMALLAFSGLVMSNRSLVYGLLLSATTCLGIGFALVTPALNVLAASFAPTATDQAVLIVNALLGAAAALAPVLLIVFVGLGFWWGLPVLAAAALLTLLIVSTRLPFDVAGSTVRNLTLRIPARFWIFAAFALIYGLCEQMNGTWAPLYMTDHFGVTMTLASLALTVFWALDAAGRVLFALTSKLIPETVVFRALPLLLVIAFVLLASLPQGANPLGGAFAFALAGIGASALLPLVISFAQRSMPNIAAPVTSLVFAMYLIGYGLAAFGGGSLQNNGIGLQELYGVSIILAMIVAILAFAIVAALEGNSVAVRQAER